MILEDLRLARVNLSGAEAEILAKAVVKLKKVGLHGTDLTTDQVNVLCDIILGEEKLVLEDMDLEGVNLGQVNAGQLARAVVKMKTVNLNYTQLTTDQLTVLCQTIVRENNLPLR